MLRQADGEPGEIPRLSFPNPTAAVWACPPPSEPPRSLVSFFMVVIVLAISPCPVPAPTKVCTKCKTEKVPSEFYGDKKRKDGKSPWCKTCSFAKNRQNADRPEVKARVAMKARERRSDPAFRERENARIRELRASNKKFKDAQREYWREFYTDPVNRLVRKERHRNRREDVRVRAQALLSAAKNRDRNCTVTLDHVLAGIERGHCPVTGIVFDLTSEHQRVTGRSRNPYSPSIDRIDCRLGYTNENTRIVITHYNFMKGQLSDDEMFFICRQIAERSPK